MHRRIYLEDIPLEEALTRLSGALERSGFLRPSPAEDVTLEDFVDHVDHVSQMAGDSLHSGIGLACHALQQSTKPKLATRTNCFNTT